jgi:hypothetical protein
LQRRPEECADAKVLGDHQKWEPVSSNGRQRDTTMPVPQQVKVLELH